MTLGLSDEDFYDLTPRQFHMLLDEHRERLEHQELLFGIVASCVANFSMAHPKDPVTPRDFMPSKHHLVVREKAEKPKRQRLNRKAIDRQVRTVMGGIAAWCKAQEKNGADGNGD